MYFSGTVRSILAPKAPISVARLPKIISQITAPGTIRLEIRQPTNRPGIASGKKIGRIHSASEMRNWITPLDIPIAVASDVKVT